MPWGRCQCHAPMPRRVPQAKRATGADGGDIPAIPITVRQLEAVIRISESLAKMQLQVRRGRGGGGGAVDGGQNEVESGTEGGQRLERD